MADVQFTHTLDLGCLGQREVRVEGIVIRGLTGQHIADVEAVMIRVGEAEIDLLPYMGERTLEAMRECVRNQWWTNAMRGREAVGERA